MKRSTHRIFAALSVSALALALSACGGGGGGSNNNNSSTGPATGTGANGSLLATYTVPAAVAAYKTTNFPTPFGVANSFIESDCATLATSTVYVGPNTLTYSNSVVSDKAQAMASDFAEQAIAKDKALFGIPASTVGYNGTKIQVCANSSLGATDGDNSTGVSGQGSNLLLNVMSADSVNFAARYPNAVNFDDYKNLYVHEMAHVFHDTLIAPFSGGLERWFEEGLATYAVSATLPSKTIILSEGDSADLITAAGSSDMTVYPFYQAVMTYILNGNGGLNYGPTNIPTFLAAYTAAAVNACKVAIPNGVGPTADQLVGMPTGYYNDCIKPNGAIDPRARAAFDTAFKATFKNADGTPLLLHTADGANSLEATVHDRLNTFLTQ